MKNQRVFGIVLIVIVFAVSLLSSCDPGGEPLIWTVITPANDAINVGFQTVFVLQYNGSLSTAIIPEQQIALPEGGLGTTIFNDANSEIVISGDTVTITMDSGEALSSETVYVSMIISGFMDSEGNAIASCTLPDYSFTTEPK